VQRCARTGFSSTHTVAPGQRRCPRLHNLLLVLLVAERYTLFSQRLLFLDSFAGSTVFFPTQSTYCHNINQHCRSIGRSVHIVNLDPAAEEFTYPVAADIRDLISLQDVMEDSGLGPNGALLYCMEHLEHNLEEWVAEITESFGDDSYVLFDCPGQIELYSHHTAVRSFANQLQSCGWRLVAVYLLDSQFVTDSAKFIAGCMQCQAAMMHLEMPHVNILNKLDLMDDKHSLDLHILLEGNVQLSLNTQSRFMRLNEAIRQLMEGYSLVCFQALDIGDEHNIAAVLYTVVRHPDHQNCKVSLAFTLTLYLTENYPTSWIMRCNTERMQTFELLAKHDAW